MKVLPAGEALTAALMLSPGLRITAPELGVAMAVGPVGLIVLVAVAVAITLCGPGTSRIP